MTLDDVLTLAKAGYTKEEIARFSLTNTPAAKDKSEAPAAQNAAPAAAAKAEPEEKEAPAPAAVAETPAGSDPFAAFNEAAEKTLAAFAEKLDKFTTLVGMPSVDNVAPKSVEDIISGFLKEV